MSEEKVKRLIAEIDAHFDRIESLLSAPRKVAEAPVPQ